MVRYEHKLDNAQKFPFFAMKECSDKKIMKTKIEDICKPNKSCFDDFVIALTVKLPETNFWGKENLHLLESGQAPDDFRIFEYSDHLAQMYWCKSLLFILPFDHIYESRKLTEGFDIWCKSMGYRRICFILPWFHWILHCLCLISCHTHNFDLKWFKSTLLEPPWIDLIHHGWILGKI